MNISIEPFSLVPKSILQPLVSFALIFAAVCISIDYRILNEDHLWANTPALISIGGHTLLMGLYTSFVLFLPEIVTAILRKLDQGKYQKEITDIERIKHHVYIIILLVLIGSFRQFTNNNFFVIIMTMTIAALIISAHQKLNIKLFWWSSLFLVPTIILLTLCGSIA